MGLDIAGLPRIDPRYWVIMLLASASGTNLGDLASQNLGFIPAFLLYALIFVAIFVVAERQQARGEMLYWVAIVVSRAGATDVADMVSHQLKLAYPPAIVLLLLLFVTVLMIGSRRGEPTLVTTRRAEGEWDSRPNANATYWAAMVTASVIGTLSGDYLADELGVGVGVGSLVLLALTGLAASVATRSQQLNKSLYWLVVLLIRTAATNLGDFLSGDDGLNLGLLAASLALLTVTLFAIILWPGRGSRSPLGLAAPERGETA